MSKSDAPVPRIADIAEPGKSMPPSTARPVIVSNRPMLTQDPMMAPRSKSVPDGTESGGDAKAEPDVSRVAKTIPVTSSLELTAPSSPASDAAKPVTPVMPAAAPVPTPAVPVVEVSTATPTPAEPTKPAEDKPPLTEPVVSTASAAAPAVAQRAPVASADEPEEDGEADGDGQLPPNQALEDAKRKADEAAAAKRAAQEKIIASRQYYLPITVQDHRRGTRGALVALLLVLVLSIAWLDIVLDAGVVRIAGLHSVTHFFK